MYVDTDTFMTVSPNTVHSFNTKVCCMSGSWIKCKVKEDSFSNCDDLHSNKFMKSLDFLIETLIIILDVISLSLDITKMRKKKQTQTFSNVYLPFLDWSFGVYLVIIALADWHYKGNYAGLKMSWVNSFACKLASFLVLVSMTVSPVILNILMLTKFCVIKWPMISKFKDASFIKRCIEVSCILAICICIILISTIFSLLGNRSLTGMCIPLYISNSHSLPLLVTILFIVSIQIFSLVTIVTLSIASLHTLKNTEKCSKILTKSRKYQKVSKKLLMNILTNFCCWIPSSIVFILPLFGYPVYTHLLSWITVTFVPINCVLNPLIFTILTPEMKKVLITFYEKTVKKTVL